MDFCTLTVCIKLRKQWPLFFPHGVIYGMIWFRGVTKAGQPLPLCTCMCLTGVYMCLTRVGKSLCMISNLPSLLLKLYTNPVPFLFFQIILNKQHKFWCSLQLMNSHGLIHISKWESLWSLCWSVLFLIYFCTLHALTSLLMKTCTFMFVTFGSCDKILKCDLSNNTSLAVLSCNTTVFFF